MILFKVPIIPDYLFELDHPNETAEFNSIYKTKNFTNLNNDLAFYMSQNFNFTNDPDFNLESAILMSNHIYFIFLLKLINLLYISN